MKTVTGCVAAVMLIACGEAPTSGELGVKRDAFASPYARLLTFAFEGELTVAYRPTEPRTLVQQQLLYTVGQLNGSEAVGRLDDVELTILDVRVANDGLTHVRYRAHLPVGWSIDNPIPHAYALKLPRRMDELEALTEEHETSCVDAAAHDVEVGNFWYYYRPDQRGCALSDEEIGTFKAVVALSDENTTGEYPEYHRIWEDGRLEVVAIFGKYEAGATKNSDAGIAAYNEFLRLARTTLGSGVTTAPAMLRTSPGVAQPDVTFTREENGRVVQITVLLVDDVKAAGADFDARYTALSTEADLIVYSGHAGLGSNVRALASKGAFRPGKYQVFFMNGCDTFAYVDGALAAQRARLNPDDPNGTKHLDMITNAMPAYFHALAGDAAAVVRGLMSFAAPLTYEQIFKGIDPQQVVVVTGEEDNVFAPGQSAGEWRGLEERGELARDEELRLVTPDVGPGTYVFELAGADGEDADLYVRVGVAPTAEAWDCRPYLGTSHERCVINVAAPAPIHLMVRAYSERASFELSGWAD